MGTATTKHGCATIFTSVSPSRCVGDYETVQKTYRAILDIFKKHEYKIDYAISKKPEYTHQYIHPRYNPQTFDEYWEEWGNKQNDSIGCVLFEIGELEKKQKGLIVQSDDDRRVLQKLVWYLSTLEYWQDPDSGMWEENEEVHASSVGACLAGLISIQGVEGVEVPPELLENGQNMLDAILPRESKGKFVDLALAFAHLAVPPYRQSADKNDTRACRISLTARTRCHPLQGRSLLQQERGRLVGRGRVDVRLELAFHHLRKARRQGEGKRVFGTGESHLDEARTCRNSIFPIRRNTTTTRRSAGARACSSSPCTRSTKSGCAQRRLKSHWRREVCAKALPRRPASASAFPDL